MKSLKCDDYCVLYDNVTGRVKVNFKKGVLEQFSNNSAGNGGFDEPFDDDPCGPTPPAPPAPGGGDPPKLNTAALTMVGDHKLVATADDEKKIANITSYVVSTSVGAAAPTYNTLPKAAAVATGSTITLDLKQLGTPLVAGTYGFKVYPLSSTITTWQAAGGFASGTAILPYGSGGGPPPKLNGGPLTMAGGTNLIALADDSSLIANITKYVISTTINGVGTPTYNTLPKAAAVATGSTITLDLKQLGTPLVAGTYGFKVYPLSSTITTWQAAGGFASGTAILPYGSGGGPPPKLNGGPLTMAGGTNLIALADDSSLIANITKYVISTTINGVGTPTYNTLPKAAAVATGSTITLDLKQLGTPLTAGKYGFKVYPLSSTITTRQASGAGGFASGTVILAFSP